MENTGYVVYWIGAPNGLGVRGSYHQHFKTDEMVKALNLMEVLRKAGMLYVGMVAENPDSVGKPGVSDKLPEDYSWTKQHRGDGPADVELTKTMIGGRSHG